jgi:RNA polymerase sigma-70 factor (ECF subfamily)
MMDTRDEAECVRLALNGDRRSFEMLVHSYERVVYTAAYRMLGNPDDARDVTQNVFLKAYRNLRSFDPSHRFFSWIYRITLNESLNALRQRRPRQELDDRMPSNELGPDAEAHGAQLRDTLQAAMLELSEDYRQAIMLRHFLHRSHQEMSELLGIPEKTVKSRLYTARQLLAKALRRRGVTSE